MILYNYKYLIEVMEAFYVLTGVQHIGLHYMSEQSFLTYPPAPNDESIFCSLIKSHPGLKAKCFECDLYHKEECKKAGAPLVYTCHIGLTEVIVPLKEDGVTISFLFTGQFIIDEHKEETLSLIKKNLKETGFDDPALQNAMKSIICVSNSKLKAIVTFMEAIAAKIIADKLFDYSNVKFFNNLNLFIDAHISEHIFVKDICVHLHLSRGSLYRYSKLYLGCELKDYIINRKINYVKSLLQDSNLKILEIPPRIGFSDYSYFARVFTKKTGFSPRAYRQGKFKHTTTFVD